MGNIAQSFERLFPFFTLQHVQAVTTFSQEGGESVCVCVYERERRGKRETERRRRKRRNCSLPPQVEVTIWNKLKMSKEVTTTHCSPVTILRFVPTLILF